MSMIRDLVSREFADFAAHLATLRNSVPAALTASLNLAASTEDEIRGLNYFTRLIL